MPYDGLDLLQKHQRLGPGACYTCCHSVARELILNLITSLQTEQAEGRMLHYPETALLSAVIDHCNGQGKPYIRKREHFRRHLREHTDWHEQPNAS